MRSLSRIYGPVLGPFEAYLTMRGIKTFPLRMERQCRNACRGVLAGTHPESSAYISFGHPTTRRRDYPAPVPKDLYGAMVSFELKDAGKAEVFAWMDRLKMIVRATSLGDVHTMVLYPAMTSHREFRRSSASAWAFAII